MAIYLIRHGETSGNRNRVVQVPETPLSEVGLAQAERLAGRLSGEGLTRILASDLARASMTAEALARRTGLEIEYDPVFQERNYGEIRGTAYADLGLNPHAPAYVPPGGESWGDFHARVDRAFERILGAASTTAGHIAVVTHGLVCHSIANRFLSLPAHVSRTGDDGPPLAFGNTALTIFQAVPPHEVSLFGCTVHLDGASESEGISGL